MTTTQRTALEVFALRVIEESRENLCDLDGGWLQDLAEELGLLVKVTVEAPCRPEFCACAEWDQFPQVCVRFSDEVRQALDAQHAQGAKP